MVALVSTLNGKLSSSVVLFRELEDMIKELWDGTGAGLSLRRRLAYWKGQLQIRQRLKKACKWVRHDLSKLLQRSLL
jgi:hypothetical protein